MPKCGNEHSLRDDGLESNLHGRMSDGLDGCTLCRPKRCCCSNACDHDRELRSRRSRGGWLSLWSRLVVGLKVQVNQWQGWVVLAVRDQQVGCPEVHSVLQQWVDVCPVPCV